jgi:membrane protein DedA with SNARE-associated domain
VTGGVAVSRGPGEPNESGWGVLIGGTIGIAAGSLVGFIIGSRKQRVLIFETS